MSDAVQCFVNPSWEGPYRDACYRLLNRSVVADVAEAIGSLPGYAPTPLVSLPGLARAAGVATAWCKHEGHRFAVGSFKPTGVVYALDRILKHELHLHPRPGAVTTADLLSGTYREHTQALVALAATSGNHGRALAWGAQLLGCRCIIYMNEQVSQGREEAIRAYGAEVRRVAGSFDEAVARVQAEAIGRDHFVVGDAPVPGHGNVPLAILQGYALIAEEMLQALEGEEPPTHVFVPGGGGRVAAAVCGHLWARYGGARPRVIVVEPTASACLHDSARAGRMVRTTPGTSLMDGLVVEQPSPAGWALLKPGAHAFLTVPDALAEEAMRQAAAGPEGDPPLAIGETGIAAWAGLLAASRDEALRDALGLDAASRVAVIATEGATDPAVYQTIVGRAPEAVEPRA